MLNIVQKKGLPDRLCGKVVVYAQILPGPPLETEEGSFPWDEMVRHGMLAVTGDFRQHHSLLDFLRNEFKGELNESLDILVRKLRELGEDIPEDLNPEDLRHYLDRLSRTDITPVPAKVVTYESPEAILQTDADVFFVGEFHGVQHAHLAVTSFPILYQALFREQQYAVVNADINHLLEQVSTQAQVAFEQLPTQGDPVVLQLEGDLQSYHSDLLDLLLGQVLPHMVYNLPYRAEFALSLQSFRQFMKPYRFQADLDEFEAALEKLRLGATEQNHHLELLCRKMAALHHEHFELLPSLQAELAQFRT